MLRITPNDVNPYHEVAMLVLGSHSATPRSHLHMGVFARAGPSGVLQNQNPTDPFDSFRGLCHVRRGGRAQDEQSEGMQSRQVEGGRQPLAQELLFGLRGQEEGERP